MNVLAVNTWIQHLPNAWNVQSAFTKMAKEWLNVTLALKTLLQCMLVQKATLNAFVCHHYHYITVIGSCYVELTCVILSEMIQNLKWRKIGEVRVAWHSFHLIASYQRKSICLNWFKWRNANTIQKTCILMLKIFDYTTGPLRIELREGC